MYGATEVKDMIASSGSSVRETSNFSLKSKILNKGTLLIIFWSFSSLLILNYALTMDIMTSSAAVTSLVIYPIAGWLADVYFGRYKVIRWSMRLLWSCIVIYAILLIVQVYESRTKDVIETYLKKLVLAIMLVPLGGLQANIIQFGIDQLVDASSWDVSSYINLYVWIYFFSEFLIVHSQVCHCGAYNRAVAFLVVPVLFMTLSVVSDMLFNHLLVKEPVSHNPLKLIVQVLKYAWKNKYPRLRSAFTYWDDKPFSRIDLGKTKFGGPFTTEQVEDVKTFFRLVLVISVSFIFFGFYAVLNSNFNYLKFQFRGAHFLHTCQNASANSFMKNCYEQMIVVNMGSLIMTFAIPIVDLVLYPLLRNWNFSIMVKLSIRWKLILSIFFYLLHEVCLLSLEVVGALRSQDRQNITCFVFASEQVLEDRNRIDLDYRWLGLSRVFSGFGTYFMLLSGIEFLCAQAPYSAKGILTGLMYGMLGFSITLSYGLFIGFRKLAETGVLDHVILGCGVWYYLSVVVVIIVMVFIACVIVKWYSFRRRDENIHNEQIFAVNYFEKYISK